MTVAKSIALFALAAVFEIGGAWLVWQGVREHRGWAWAGFGVLALGAYGFVATLQPDANFGRILAAYGGVFRGDRKRGGAGRGGSAPCASRDRCCGAWFSTASGPTGGTSVAR